MQMKFKRQEKINKEINKSPSITIKIKIKVLSEKVHLLKDKLQVHIKRKVQTTIIIAKLIFNKEVNEMD